MAADAGFELDTPAWRRSLAHDLAASQRLSHLVGANGFFTALLRSARRRPGCALEEWWSERRCGREWGAVVRPDGYGVWREEEVRLPFLLEYDNGTETLARLAAKLDGYRDLAKAAGHRNWVLFSFGSPRREHEASRALAGNGVPVATASRSTDSSPDRAVWTPLTARVDRRLRTVRSGRPPDRGSVTIAFDAGPSTTLGTKVAAGAGSLVLLVAVLAGAAGAGVASFLGGGESAPSSSAVAQIPPAMLALYQQAAATCAGLPWTVLAAIGTVESDNGQSTLPGVHSGANSAGAEGPMQFEPSTFAEYDEPVPPGGANPPSPYDPTDAVYAAARDLCANGAANGANLSAAIYAYNHSSSYVSQVLALAQSYGQTTAQTVAERHGRGYRAGLGPGPGGHAVYLGWRDAGRRFRLQRSRPGGLQGGRDQPAPGRSGPVRRRTAGPGRRSAPAG